MTPTIVDTAELRVVGIEARFISILSPDKTNDAVIPKLWDEFSKRSHQIKDRIGSEALGLIYCLDDEPKAHPNECLYMCGVKVPRNSAELPEGMIYRDVPGGKYAVFKHQGSPDTFQHTMNYIYGSWFPRSGYEFDDRPEIEVYAGIDQESEPAGWDIWIPIRHTSSTSNINKPVKSP